MLLMLTEFKGFKALRFSEGVDVEGVACGVVDGGVLLAEFCTSSVAAKIAAKRRLVR